MNKKLPQKRGLLVTFEGGEGAGKSTQIKLLRSWLKKRGIPLLVTRQPGGSPIGTRIRSLLLAPKYSNLSPRAEVLLYTADRAQHVDEVVLPALQKGTVVISDRFSESSVVYQGICRKLGVGRIRDLNAFATNGLAPDLVIVLDVPAAVGAQRVLKRKSLDRLELEKRAFHEKVRKGFLQIAKEEPRRFAVVNGTLPAEAVALEIQKRLEKPLKMRRLWK
jgi:dTMP kinase